MGRVEREDGWWRGVTRDQLLAAIARNIEVGTLMAVVGAAWIFPPLGLLVAAASLFGQAVVADRRLPEAKP